MEVKIWRLLPGDRAEKHDQRGHIDNLSSHGGISASYCWFVAQESSGEGERHG